METTKKKPNRTRKQALTIRMTKNEKDDLLEKLNLINPKATQLAILKEITDFYISEKKLR